ncbi:MAG: competence/damage-inducible protein A [Ignavibacteriae bacterium]|nr:competence/damage-inducible protein A [Ignavibacteriota bacterium]
MKSEIITIGDELLIGQIINTNQAYIAEQLNAIGVRVDRMTTVGDDMTAILEAFEAAWKHVDVVIVTGGLGPTHDDITKKAVCTFFDSDLAPNEEIKLHIQELLKRWNRQWSALSEEQTLFPQKAQLVPNPVGTAGGILFEEDGKFFYVLPGVPQEMKEMIDKSIVPFLATHVKNSVIRHLTLRTSGISESLLANQLGDLDELLQGAKLAFLPSPTGVRLRITVHGNDEIAVERLLSEVEQRIRAHVQKYIYGTNLEELEETIGNLLTSRKLTLAVSESCTGGLVADKITDVSGSSNYFQQGLVTYSNPSKVDVLGVPSLLIEQHGAVSKEVAEAMAAGIRRIAHTDIGLSTTGIAGPTGATSTKPLGLVWVGYSDAETTFATRYQFGGDRRRVKERAAQAALELLRRRLLKIE